MITPQQAQQAARELARHSNTPEERKEAAKIMKQYQLQKKWLAMPQTGYARILPY